MRLEEREKDLRAQDYMEEFITEFHRMLTFKDTIFDPRITVFDYRNPRRRFNVRGYENWPTHLSKMSFKGTRDFVPEALVINLHGFLKGLKDKGGPEYQAGENFPTLYMNFNAKSPDVYYAYTHKKLIFEFTPKEYFAKFRKFQKRLPDLNPIEIFYIIIEDKLFNLGQPAKGLVHEVSHMFDDLFEFRIKSDQDEDTPDEEYFNEFEEIEARIREVVFTYYRSKQELFQYLANELAKGENVNNWIGDILKDMVAYYEAIDIWKYYDEETRNRILKRLFTAVQSLLNREVDKLVNPD